MIDGSNLVAHRGESSRYPENTLAALAAAIDAGARHVEFDVQFSHDTIPVVFHDLYVERTTGLCGRILDYPVDRLKAMRINGTTHANASLVDTTIPTLHQAIELLNRNPEVTAYVELKRQSLEHFGLQPCIDRVIEALASAQFPWVLISFLYDALRYLRMHYDLPIGWVLHEYSDTAKSQAQSLEPAYLFCNFKRLPQIDQPFWQGPWQWVVYDINDPHQALSLLDKGAHMIETSCITEMLNTSTLSTSNPKQRGTKDEITRA
jgi:glycerophosphoryl diester phosphodiesterase